MLLQKSVLCFIYLDVQEDLVGRVGQVVPSLHWHQTALKQKQKHHECGREEEKTHHLFSSFPFSLSLSSLSPPCDRLLRLLLCC